MIKKLICLLALIALNPLFASPLPDKPHIYVEGSSIIEIEPDLATFTLHLKEVDTDVEKAKSNIDQSSVDVLRLCKELNIPNDSVVATGLRVNEKHRYDRELKERVYVGVEVSRSITITLNEIERFRDVQHELIGSNLSKNVDIRLKISDQKSTQDEAQKLALIDATARAENLAELQGKKLAGVYSISEFNLRREETYKLHPSREIKEGGAMNIIAAEDIGSPSGFSEALHRVSGVSIDPFDSGKMRATATIYVVFLIK